MQTGRHCRVNSHHSMLSQDAVLPKSPSIVNMSFSDFVRTRLAHILVQFEMHEIRKARCSSTCEKT